VGYYNELLVSGEDYEFNCRIKKLGGKIWLNPAIQVQYYNQESLIKFYKKQFSREGHYNTYMWYVAPYTFAYRHSIPGVFALGIIGGFILSFFSLFMGYVFISVVAVYFLVAVISSIQQARRYRKFMHIFTLPFCFFFFHFFYGMGILSGIFKLIFHLAPIQKK
jgi:GT2 family glycosyltransferase